MNELKYLRSIEKEHRRLDERFRHLLVVNPDLDRRLVSYQANRQENDNRWCKYKEGYSAALMRYLFHNAYMERGTIIDPFAGSGTTLFAASDAGLDSLGIELLPCSIAIIEARGLLRGPQKNEIVARIKQFNAAGAWRAQGRIVAFPHLGITQGAFPTDNERALGRYLAEIETENPHVQAVLRFAAMCILESISFTRKDGQYLRWDYRADRRARSSKFDKGEIESFHVAIERKLAQIVADVLEPRLADSSGSTRGTADVIAGTCLHELPQMSANRFDGLITSPPYCNRYDYTRTYALELAMLGAGEQELKQLRQAMLSCTVENKKKLGLREIVSRTTFRKATAAFQQQAYTQQVVEYLQACRTAGTLNNRGIPRMVENYFREMALVIFECGRILKPGAPCVMVNDNVRYGGVHLPVDLMLADLAEAAGLKPEVIWVLPRGKGNSSQQMGKHGRQEVRKCVYVWRKGRSAKKPPAATAVHQPSRTVAGVR